MVRNGSRRVGRPVWAHVGNFITWFAELRYFFALSLLADHATVISHHRPISQRFAPAIKHGINVECRITAFLFLMRFVSLLLKTFTVLLRYIFKIVFSLYWAFLCYSYRDWMRASKLTLSMVCLKKNSSPNAVQVCWITLRMMEGLSRDRKKRNITAFRHT